jgi:hypothetical protein
MRTETIAFGRHKSVRKFRGSVARAQTSTELLAVDCFHRCCSSIRPVVICCLCETSCQDRSPYLIFIFGIARRAPLNGIRERLPLLQVAQPSVHCKPEAIIAHASSTLITLVTRTILHKEVYCLLSPPALHRQTHPSTQIESLPLTLYSSMFASGLLVKEASGRSVKIEHDAEIVSSTSKPVM